MQTPRCFSKKNDDEQVNFKIDLRPRFLFLLNFFFQTVSSASCKLVVISYRIRNIYILTFKSAGNGL